MFRLVITTKSETKLEPNRITCESKKEMATTKTAPANTRKRKPTKPQEEVTELIKAEGTVAVGSVIALTILLALGSFTLSFGALEQLAAASAVTAQVTWIWPVIVDGFIVLATIASYVLRNRDNGATRRYPWFALILFAVVSIAGNAYHAYLNLTELLVPVWVAALVNSAPAIALLLASHLLVIMLQTPRRKKEPKLAQAVAEAVYPPQALAAPLAAPVAAVRPSVAPETASPAPLNIVGVNNELTADLEPNDETVQPVKRPKPAQNDELLNSWALARVENNEPLNSTEIVAFLGEGTSLRTGQRKMKTLRERFPEVEEYVKASAPTSAPTPAAVAD